MQTDHKPTMCHLCLGRGCMIQYADQRNRFIIAEKNIGWQCTKCNGIGLIHILYNVFRYRFDQYEMIRYQVCSIIQMA